jgi:putative drug exporter of the RND superfamily
MSSARRLTATVGRWSASHPWTTIAAWLGAVAVLLVAGHLAGTIQLPNGAQNVGPSGQAEQMISRDLPRHAAEDVLFDSATLRVSDPAYQAAISDVLSRIQATGRVTQVQSPLDPRFTN